MGDEPVTIHVVPDLFRFASLRGGVEEFEGMPFIHLRDSPLHGWSQRGQARLRLRVLSARCSSASAPVLLLLALGVKLTSRGPVFYRQERMGLDGQRFQMLKLRTMRGGRGGGDRAGLGDPDDDPRRIPFGAFLRRLSLDELPQFVERAAG